VFSETWGKAVVTARLMTPTRDIWLAVGPWYCNPAPNGIRRFCFELLFVSTKQTKIQLRNVSGGCATEGQQEEAVHSQGLKRAMARKLAQGNDTAGSTFETTTAVCSQLRQLYYEGHASWTLGTLISHRCCRKIIWALILGCISISRKIIAL
jgi:hypothetical protein